MEESTALIRIIGRLTPEINPKKEEIKKEIKKTTPQEKKFFTFISYYLNIKKLISLL